MDYLIRIPAMQQKIAYAFYILNVTNITNKNANYFFRPSFGVQKRRDKNLKNNNYSQSSLKETNDRY